MHLEFRPAQSADAAAATPLIYSSGPAAFDFVFADKTRGTAQEFLQFAFADGRAEFGCHSHVVGVQNQSIVAAGACFCQGFPVSWMLSTVRQMLRFYGLLRGAAAVRRGLKIERLIKPPAPQTAYLAHLGVTPDLRGQGIGKQLVQHLLEQGRQQGCPVAVLDVSMENPKAQALYERLGFAVTEELPSHLPGIPGHRRMQKDLAGAS